MTQIYNQFIAYTFSLFCLILPSNPAIPRALCSPLPSPPLFPPDPLLYMFVLFLFKFKLKHILKVVQLVTFQSMMQQIGTSAKVVTTLLALFNYILFSYYGQLYSPQCDTIFAQLVPPSQGPILYSRQHPQGVPHANFVPPQWILVLLTSLIMDTSFAHFTPHSGAPLCSAPSTSWF